MNKRLVLGTAALAVLLVTSGCLGAIMGPQDVSDTQLNEEPPVDYAFDSDRDVHITVTENAQFAAVYEMNGSSIELFRRDGFGGRNSIPVSALRYQYENGTVLNGTQLKARGGSVQQTREVVTVTLPSDANADGKLAFTSSSSPKRFSLPTYVEGSYEVVLPPDRRVDFFLFGQVRPSADERFEDDQGRTHLQWENVDTESVLVQFYLQRDLYIFGGIAALLVLVAGGGLAYYKRQIEALRERRQQMGLSVDVSDDDDGPPPGMG
ncbi:hypothetical protein SAMN04487949_3856 [Halogranum gelatinilyticum]|uniref:Uncharacterized protein n=1 Tax=Halogranum gelatinilyticum TaxID=660521 RepID=A0A1H0A815_9EURY|nr:DUF5803 family protein [Halogranum gelatinilyticum]SDN29354.1 hypothetical protein SAMN04487949_3856 [Halogranum gelatinilyticum]